MGDIISLLTELAEPPAIDDWLVLTDKSDTTQAASGTTKKNKPQYGLGAQVNAQTGTTYTYQTTDFRKLVTHTNATAIAGTLPQAGASFPAGWYMLVQNRGAGALTITPTTSTVDGAASLVLNQNEGSIIVSDGTNYFTLRGKATGAAGVGDVVGPGSATDNALARYDLATGKLIQNSPVTLDDTGAFTVPEMAAPGTPTAGKVVVYAKTDGKLYIKDDAGAETDLTSTGAALTADAVSAPVYAADAGASDAYAITLSPAPSSYTTGTHYRFKANTANTGACTLDVNSLGAKTIKKVAGGITTDLADNDIRAGQFVDVIYDGTNMQMQSTLGNAPTASPGGSDKYIQYNDGGAFGGASDFTFDETTRIVQLSQSNNGRIGFSNNAGVIAHGCLAAGAVGTIKVLSDGSAAGSIYSPETAMTTVGSDPRPFLGLVGQVQTHTLTGNRTLGFVGTDGGAVAKDGTIFTLIFIQDGTGSRTLAWNSGYKFAGGTTPTLTTTAGAVDIFRFVVSGTGTVAYCIGQFLDVK